MASFATTVVDRTILSPLKTLTALLLIGLSASSLCAQSLDELPLDRWKELTETQRYQLQIAEKYYREKKYKIAAAEYKKYLRLYEQSVAGAYAQLKWSQCHVHLRQSNTAIKEGFQSVVDYWPDSPEATAAAYYIGSTYQSMGRISQAKKALRKVVSDHPDHLAASFAIKNLIEIAAQEKDAKSRVELLKKLTFDVKRIKPNERLCLDASRTLAALMFYKAAFDEGVKSLATSYKEGLELDDQVAALVYSPISTLTGKDETRAQGEKLTSAAIAYFREQTPAATDDEAKKAALEYGFHVAAAHAYAKHDTEVPKVYEQIFRTLGPNDEILRRLAEWYKSKKKYEEARAVYRRYADKVEGLSQVAYSYRQQGNVDSAISAYNQLVSQDSESSIKWRGEIAATYRAAKQYQEAINEYEGLMAEDIENAEKWRWQIATAYENWGKYKEAIGHYRQCTNFPQNYKQMAHCNRQLKKYQEAIVLYNQIMTHEPSAPEALYQIAKTYEDAQQKEPAIKTFQLVCKRYPKNNYASLAHARLQDQYKISVTLGGSKDE